MEGRTGTEYAACVGADGKVADEVGGASGGRNDIYFVFGSSIVGSSSCLLKATISAFLPLMISSTYFTSVGSYPNFITKSSKDFIFVSLAKADISLILAEIGHYLLNLVV